MVMMGAAQYKHACEAHGCWTVQEAQHGCACMFALLCWCCEPLASVAVSTLSETCMAGFCLFTVASCSSCPPCAPIGAGLVTLSSLLVSLSCTYAC